MRGENVISAENTENNKKDCKLSHAIIDADKFITINLSRIILNFCVTAFGKSYTFAIVAIALG